MGCVLRTCSTPSAVKAVFSTNLQGALNRQRSAFRPPLPREYLTQVGLCVWTCVAPAQKFASSSNAAENCSVLSRREEMSDVTDRSVCTAQNPSWSKSCLACQPSPGRPSGEYFKQPATRLVGIITSEKTLSTYWMVCSRYAA
ncbi:hypothetical protein BFJ70_g17860 [Fusarium oxysporum]|nr:hypothetical protein BFJ70_g17860 [Fusarium oxysporum]